MEVEEPMEIDVDNLNSYPPPQPPEKPGHNNDNLLKPGDNINNMDKKLLDRESSIKFSEQIIFERNSELRRRPWFTALPVRRINLVMYRSLVGSQCMQPFQLVGLGNTLLSLLKDLSGCSRVWKTPLDRDLDKYLGILETIFVRLKSYEDDGQLKEGAKSFADTVWELHTSGLLDLSKTTIPRLMVNSSLSHLENVLSSCFGSGADLHNTCPSPLIPLCESNPENFLNVMQFLRMKYFEYSDSDPKLMRTHILDFGSKLQVQLRQKLGHGYCFSSLFPTPFQPLLYFLSQIIANPGRKTLMQNDVVREEIRNLVNNISHMCELMKFNSCDLIFIIVTIPDLPHEIIFNEISNKSCLWFRRCLKKSELKIPPLPVCAY